MKLLCLWNHHLRVFPQMFVLFRQTKHEALCCTECPGGQIWNDYGHYCTRTCYPQWAPCPRIYIRRCECPPGLYWHRDICVSWKICEDVMAVEGVKKTRTNPEATFNFSGFRRRRSLHSSAIFNPHAINRKRLA